LLEVTAAPESGYGRVLAWSHWHVWKSNCVCIIPRLAFVSRRTKFVIYTFSRLQRQFLSIRTYAKGGFSLRQHGTFLFAGHYSPGRANNDLQAMNYLCLA
jgi:hypothetical protein